MNSFPAVSFEDDNNGCTLNDLERDAVTEKSVNQQFRKKGYSDDGNGDIEKYSHESNDKDISHDNNYYMMELYCKTGNGVSEKSICLRSENDNTYRHIAYVLECVKDHFHKKNNKDIEKEDVISNEVNHNIGMDGKNQLQFGDCY